MRGCETATRSPGLLRRRPTAATWVALTLAALLPPPPVTHAATADVLVSPTGEQPRVALRARDHVVVVWNEGVAVRARLFRLGQPLGSAFRVDDVGDAADPSPQVAMDDAGSFVVVWDGGGGRPGIRARLFAADGRPLGGSFRVSGSGDRDPRRPLVAMGPEGSFAIAWEETRAGAARLRIAAFGSRGAPLGRIRSLPARGDVIALLGGIAAGPGFFAAGWTEVSTCSSGGDVAAAVSLFDGSGQSVAVCRIADKPPCDSEGPAVFALPGSDLGPLAVLAGERFYTIQRFAPDSCERLGPRRGIAPATGVLAVGGDGRGRLAVVREVSFLVGDQEHDEFEPQIRLISSDGDPLTDWLFVSGLTSLAHQPAAVALARNGTAVVVWKRVANDPKPGILLTALSLP